MIAIDPWAGLLASAVIMAIFQYLRRKAPPARWADSQRSYHLQMAREHLLEAAAKDPEHIRNWRPNILTLWPGEEKAAELTRLASWLEGGTGFNTLLKIVEVQGPRTGSLRSQAAEELAKQVRSQGLPAFPLVVAAADETEALLAASQAYGLGPIKGNLVLQAWPEAPGKQLAQSTRGLSRLGFNQALWMGEGDARRFVEPLPPGEKRIDLWWKDGASSRLMLLLAYLMTRHQDWQEARIRVLAPAHSGQEQNVLAELEEHLEQYRIKAQPQVVTDADSAKMAALCQAGSLTLVPVSLTQEELLDPFGRPAGELKDMCASVLLVKAAQDLNLAAEPEQGKVAEASQALDELERAERRLKAAIEVEQRVQKEEAQKIEHAKDPDSILQGDWMERMRDALEAHERVERAQRRQVKAQVMYDRAKQKAQELGLSSEGEPAP